MTDAKKKAIFPKILIGACALILLAGCQTTGNAGRNADVDSAMERASHAKGGQTQSLSALEKAYKRDSSDAKAALNYAAALREGGYVNRAAIVLAPFASEDPAEPGVKSEYAAIQLALGNYRPAEEYAKQAILQDDKDYNAFHYLGISLDAQQKHPEAERAFRKGLQYWEGDPAPIMNNLALNLATQGFVQESIEILQKAASISPGRPEIERNLRIVMSLYQSSGHKALAPKPKAKPARS